jgi:hypothetical protein
MSTLCLNMIVKNESKVITRCLDSMLPHIHSWVILDTGSTDGTQNLIRQHLRGLPGELFEMPWTDFGRARTQALERVGKRADYVLFMDADDILVCPEGFAFPPLTADAYSLHLRMGAEGAALSYSRICVASTQLPWRFQGVLHEALACAVPFQAAHLDGPVIHASSEGARSRDPEKYLKDVQVLREALKTEPDNTRDVFYLAQSCRDAGLLEEAIETYLRRAAMGRWEEEVWFSLFEAARLMELQGWPVGTVAQTYLKAYQARPARAEPLCGLARFYRLREDFHVARMFAAQAMAIPRPADLLFLDEGCYQWRCLDEYAVASYWTGHARECLEACERLLTERPLPAAERPRVEANREWARQALTARAC